MTTRRTGICTLVAAVFLALVPDARADREYAVDGVSVARTTDGSLLVADYDADQIRRVDPSTGATSVVVGIAGGGFSGDGGLATGARLDGPEAIAALPDGGYLIADSHNDRIRRVSPDGIITTVAGGGLGDSGCVAARSYLPGPTTIAPTGDGMVTLTDRGARRVGDGIVGTVTNGEPFAPRDAQPAADGTVLVVSAFSVTRVAPDGSRRVVAGRGHGDSGDGGPATEATFGNLKSVAPLADGGFLVLDSSDGGRLRRVLPNGTITAFGPPRIDYADQVVADPKGGALVINSFRRTLLAVSDPSVRPAAVGALGRGEGNGCTGLDESFGGGVVRMPGPYPPARPPVALVPSADGNALLVGTFEDAGNDPHVGSSIVHPDGTLSGVSLLAGEESAASDAVGLTDGRVIVVGSSGGSDPRLLVLRLRPDGSLDPSFPLYRGRGVGRLEPRVTAGPDGVVTVSGGGALLRLSAAGTVLGETTAGSIRSLATRADGSVIALGDVPSTLWLDRYVDGRPDFHREYALGTSWTDLAVGPDDAITAVGAPNLVAHLRPDGSLASTTTLPGAPQAVVVSGDRVAIFGGEYQPFVALPGGTTRTPAIGRQSYFTTGAVLPDGRVLAASNTFDRFTSVAVARFLPASLPAGAGDDAIAGGEPTDTVGTPSAGSGVDPNAQTGGDSPGTASAHPEAPSRQADAPSRPAAKASLRLATLSSRGCPAVRVTSSVAGTVRLTVQRGKRTVLRRTVRLERGSATLRLCGAPRHSTVHATQGKISASSTVPRSR